MKIRTKLKLNTWISVGTFIIMLAALAWSFFDSSRTYRDLTMINELRKVAADRIMLRDDYLLHREERAKIQWQAKSETIRGLLDMADARFAQRENKALLKEARKAFEATFTSFSEFLDKNKREKRTADKTLDFTDAEARLINQVLLKAYILNDNITLLHEAVQKKANTASERRVLFIVLFVMGGVVAIVLNTIFIGKLLNRKIAVLSAGMDIIGTGNLDYRIETTGNDELSNLARASNEMVDSLKASREYAESIINTVREPLIVLDQDLRVITASRSFYEVFKVKLEETVGQLIYDLGNKQWDISKLRELLETILPEKATFDNYEVEHDFTAIGRRVMLLNARQIQRVLGKERIILVAIEDITERKELERGVVKARDDAEAANKELEAFSYSVSHDLRAPLRGMDGFSHALLEDYSDKLDATGKNYLERIRTGAQRMGLLIDDMLKLSRVSRAEFRRESIDLSKMVQAILLTVRQNNPARDVKVSIQKDIIIEGDRRLLEIALTNLIDNAWKFTGKTKNARIEFGTLLTDGKPVMFIRDNGAGFDMTYVDKLFGAFQRLHTTAEFPGTGIGLATVQRVIHRHGGQVWVEGEVGKGATFFFTIP
jgi:PAS domain S-box-containing protein